ncbi:hypothetical protein ACF0H5_003256 [Mactra antiquata]
MSFRAKATFGTSCLISFAVVSYVHISHKLERDAMKVGVQMDIERQQRKKENLQILEEQRMLAEKLKAQDIEPSKESSR